MVQDVYFSKGYIVLVIIIVFSSLPSLLGQPGVLHLKPFCLQQGVAVAKEAHGSWREEHHPEKPQRKGMSEFGIYPSILLFPLITG